MSSFSTVVLSTAYFPPVDLFIALANGKKILMEKNETFLKQSYRNRCKIYASDGVLPLSIPVQKADGDLITQIKIDYTKSWLQQHKRAIVSAYNSSPFFEYYQDDIFSILDSKEENLFTLNEKLIFKLMELIGLKNNIEYTSEYIQSYPDYVLDLRGKISPKIDISDIMDSIKIKRPYYQVFSDKYGFISNLSIIDTLFNEGPNTIDFLR